MNMHGQAIIRGEIQPRIGRNRRQIRFLDTPRTSDLSNFEEELL